MRLLLLLLSVGFFVLSCKSEDDGNEVTIPDDENTNIQELYEFENNKELSIEQYDPSLSEEQAQKFVNVCEGDFTVFKYTYNDLGQEGVADSGFSEYVYFQVDSALDSFEFNGAEITAAKAILGRSCFCDFSYTNPFYIENGTISGEKLSDDSWAITIDIEEDESVVEVDETFSESADAFSCTEIEEIETVAFTGGVYSCADISVNVFEKELDNTQRALLIYGASKNDLNLTEEPNTFDLPLDNLNVEIRSYDMALNNAYFCNDIAILPLPEVVDTWSVVSGTITLSVPGTPQLDGFFEIYNLTILLENAVFENEQGGQLMVEELALEDLLMGWLPG